MNTGPGGSVEPDFVQPVCEVCNGNHRVLIQHSWRPCPACQPPVHERRTLFGDSIINLTGTQGFRDERAG